MADRTRGYGVDCWKIDLANIDERVDLASTLAVTKTLALFMPSGAAWSRLRGRAFGIISAGGKIARSRKNPLEYAAAR